MQRRERKRLSSPVKYIGRSTIIIHRPRNHGHLAAFYIFSSKANFSHITPPLTYLHIVHRVTFIRITRRSFSISIHHFRKNFPILFLLLEIISLSLSITSLAMEFDVSIRDPRVIPIAWNPPGRKTLACKQPQGELLPPSSFAFEIRLPLKSKFQSPPLKGSDWIVECLRYFVSITFL